MLKSSYYLLKIFILWLIPQCWPFILLTCSIIIWIFSLWLIIIAPFVFVVFKYIYKCYMLFLLRPVGWIKWSLDGPIFQQKYIVKNYWNRKGVERKKKIAHRLAYKYNAAMIKYSNELDVDMNKIFNMLYWMVHGIPTWCINQSNKEKKKYENSK